MALYYDFFEHVKNGIDEMQLLKDALPGHLEREFVLFSTHQLVLNVPMFAVCDASFLQGIMLALEPQFYVTQEWIVRGKESLASFFHKLYNFLYVFW